MNVLSIFNMKNKLFHSDSKSLKITIVTITPPIIYLSTVALVFFFATGCNGNNSTGKNRKTDTIYVQPQTSEEEGMDGNHGGMGDDRRGMDSSHRGMDSMKRRHQREK